jgi:Tol biopolymer transport system component
MTDDLKQVPPTGPHIGLIDLSWSPNRLRLAMVDGSPTADVTRLYVRDIDSAGLFHVTDGRTNARSPVWSGDGRTLYFVQNSLDPALHRRPHACR